MAIKNFKALTPGQRQKIGLDYSNLDKKSPEKSLTKGLSFRAGRDDNGRISVRRKGGRAKRLYRKVDFFRIDKAGVEGRVVSVEYDPNRSANIALVFYKDGDKRYIVASKNLKKGDVIVSGEKVEPKEGNLLPLENIPLGTVIHNVELKLGKGAQLARSAGCYATLVAKEKDYVSVKLPSGEVRMVFKKCRATIGTVGNGDHMNISLGKAGASRWRGRRPKVRGVAMNPFDHPHGGGNGSTAGGRHPVSPTGVPAKGFKTRKKKNLSNKFILTKRKK